MPKFITLSGKKQTGKTTAGEIIADLLRSQNTICVITAFAEPLKRMCIEILGLKPEEVYGTDAQKDELSHILWDGFPEEIRLKYGTKYILAKDGISDPVPRSGAMTNREVLQVVGTDIFRAIYGDVWAKLPFNKKWSEDVVVLNDGRFPNEIQATEDAGGVIIRLERDTDLEDNHPSETALDNFLFENIYQNNGSIQELESYLLKVLIHYDYRT